MESTPKAAKCVNRTPCDSPLTPNECKSQKPSPCQQMSASLKERLKRSRRSFISPSSVAKRLCVENEESGGQQVMTYTKEMVPKPPRDGQNVDINQNPVESATESFSETNAVPTQSSPGDVLAVRKQLRTEVKEKTEVLRRLKMVKMYRNKNDLTHLQTLIDKWRSCAQEALYQLQTDLPIDGGKASLSQLIDLYGLEDKILHFDRLEEDFTD